MLRTLCSQPTYRQIGRVVFALAFVLLGVISAIAQDPEPLPRFSEEKTKAAFTEMEAQLKSVAGTLKLKDFNGTAQPKRYDQSDFLPPEGEEASYPAIVMGSYDQGIHHEGSIDRPVEVSLRRFRTEELAGVSLRTLVRQQADYPEFKPYFGKMPSPVRDVGDESGVCKWTGEERLSDTFGYAVTPAYSVTWRWGPWVMHVVVSNNIVVPFDAEEKRKFAAGEELDMTEFHKLRDEADRKARNLLADCARMFDGAARRVEDVLEPQPTLKLDRKKGTRGSIIKVQGRGFGRNKDVKLYIDGTDYFAARRTDPGGTFEGWMWIPDEVGFGVRKIWGEAVGGDMESNKIDFDVQPVAISTLMQRFDVLVSRYQKAIPTNDRWYGKVRSGAINNIGYAAGTVGASAIYAATSILTLGKNPQSVFPDGNFVCSNYQANVLKFLDAIRWNEDPAQRELLDGFNHGPMTSGPAKIKWASHYFVAVWPHGPALGSAAQGIAGGSPTWSNSAIAFDPWIKQKPWLFELTKGSASWAHSSSYASQWKSESGILPTFVAPTPEAFGYYKNLYPITGAKFYAPPEDQPRIVPEYAAGNEPAQAISVHSPVRLEIRSRDGRLCGRTASGEEMNQIPGAEMFTLEKPNGGRAWFAALPEGEFEVKVIATGDGSFHLHSKQAGKKIQAYQPVSIRAGDVATIVLNSTAAPAVLTSADGTKLSPTSLDQTNVGEAPSVVDPSPGDIAMGDAPSGNDDTVPTSSTGSGSQGTTARGTGIDPSPGASGRGRGSNPDVGSGSNPRDAGRGDSGVGSSDTRGGSNDNDTAVAQGPPTSNGGDPRATSARRRLTSPIAGTDSSRTFHYEQITGFTATAESVKAIHIGPYLSDNGKKVFFATRKDEKRAWVMDVDGSNMQRVDVLISGPDQVDMSGNGSRLVSNDYYKIQASTVGGARTRDLFRDKYGKIQNVRISGNGEYVAFAMSGTQRGIYTIGFNGRGRQLSASPEAVGQVLGVPADHVHRFTSNGTSLDISYYGSHIVFACHSKAYGISKAGAHVFTVHRDGSGLRRVAGPFEWVHSVGISGNDGTVVYVANRDGEDCFGASVSVNGGGNRVIANAKELGYPGQGVGTAPAQVSYDGSVVVMGRRPYAFATDASSKTPLGTPGGQGSRFNEILIKCSAASDMHRFVFQMYDVTGHVQIGVLNIESYRSSMPKVQDIYMSPVELTIGTGEWLDVSASAKIPPQTLQTSQSCTFYLDGTYSPIGWRTMRDDGKSEDMAKDDGNWGLTKQTFSSSCKPGSYTVRIKAEVRDARNRLRATAVEVAGPDVLAP